MLATTYEEKFYGLGDFIDYIKGDKRFENALKMFVRNFKEDVRDGLDLIEPLELSARNIDEFIKELKESGYYLNTALSTDEMISYAEFICDEADVICEVEVDEEGNLVYREIHLDFNPRVFKNVAFLYWLRREDVEEAHGKLSDEQWNGFKELYEELDLPDSVFEAIKDFEFEVIDQVKGDKGDEVI